MVNLFHLMLNEDILSFFFFFLNVTSGKTMGIISSVYQPLKSHHHITWQWSNNGNASFGIKLVYWRDLFWSHRHLKKKSGLSLVQNLIHFELRDWQENDTKLIDSLFFCQTYLAIIFENFRFSTCIFLFYSCFKFDMFTVFRKTEFKECNIKKKK